MKMGHIIRSKQSQPSFITGFKMNTFIQITVLMFMKYAMDHVLANTGGKLHFHDCKLCKCFWKIEDRDIFNQGPAGQVQMAYDVSEDECLNICMSDLEECAAVVYGVVGGRDVFACELYSTGPTPILPDGPQYLHGLNVYIPIKNRPCDVDRSGYKQVDAGPVNEMPEQRKAYFKNLYAQKNPFNWGRKK